LGKLRLIEIANLLDETNNGANTCYIFLGHKRFRNGSVLWSLPFKYESL